MTGPPSPPQKGDLMILPKPECNVGDKPITHRQAANAIFNKLSMAISILLFKSGKGAEALAAVCESQVLSDAIVKEPSAKEEGTRTYFEKIVSLEQLKALGDQMAGLTKNEAEDLRRYLIEEYGVLPGCVEGLVWQKYDQSSKYRRKPESESEFYNEFASQFIVFGAPGG